MSEPRTPDDRAEGDIAAYAKWRRDPNRITADSINRSYRSAPRAEGLREALEHVLDVWPAPSPEEFARLHRVLTGHDSCSSRPSDERVPPLEIPSYDGKMTASLGQGQDCVLVQIIRDGQLQAGIVLKPHDAEDMARSLMKRAEYAREPSDERVPESEEPR